MTIDLKKETQAIFFSFLGWLILAFSVVYFSWQYRLINGGFAGYGLLLNYLLNISLGKILLFLNILIFIVSFLTIGIKAGIKSIIGYIIFPLLVDLTRNLLHLEQITSVQFFNNLAFSFLQAAVAGLGVSLFLHFEYTVGGFGPVALILKKYFRIPPPNFMFFMDFILVILSSLFVGLDRGLFMLWNAVVFFFSFKYFSGRLQKLS